MEFFIILENITNVVTLCNLVYTKLSNIDNIFHEIAHAIEFIKSGYSAEDRALYGSFQFIIKYHEFFQRCIDVQTNQITMREVKTFAIQLALMKQLGWKFDSLSWINSHVELLVWLPDFLNNKGKSEKEKLFFLKVKMINCNKNIVNHYIL